MPPALGEVVQLAQMSRAATPKAPSKPKQAAPHRNLRRRLSPPAIDELVARYTAGETTPALSQEFEISETVCLTSRTVLAPCMLRRPVLGKGSWQETGGRPSVALR